MNDICLAVAIFTGLSLIGNCSGQCEDNRNLFTYQPCNITVYEGEDVEFNCTPIQRTALIATWVINGERYYWADLLATPYSFNLQDNSLTITNTPRTFNGYSYQCILSRYSSTVAYLTVLYCCDTTSSPNSSQLISYSSESDIVITRITSIEISSTVKSTTAIMNGERIINSTDNQLYVIVVAPITAGIMVIVISIVAIVLVFIKVRLLKRNSQSVTIRVKRSQDFEMDKNEVYGQIHVNQTLVNMSKNQAYEYTEVALPRNQSYEHKDV